MYLYHLVRKLGEMVVVVVVVVVVVCFAPACDRQVVRFSGCQAVRLLAPLFMVKIVKGIKV
jgi:hypothetical protein